MKISYRDFLQLGEIEQRELYYDEKSRNFYISKYKAGTVPSRRINLVLPSISPFIMTLLLRTLDKHGNNTSLVALLVSHGLAFVVFRLASHNYLTADFEVLPYNSGNIKIEQHLTSLIKSVYFPLILLVILALLLGLFNWLYIINGQSINLFMIFFTTLLILLLSHMKPVKRVKVLHELIKK